MSIENQNSNEKKYPQLFFAGAKGMLAWVVLSLVLTVVGYLLETLLSDGGITKLAADILTVIALMPVLGILDRGDSLAARVKREAAEDKNVKITSFWFEKGGKLLKILAVVRVLGFFVRVYREISSILYLGLNIPIAVADIVLSILILVFICNGFAENCKDKDGYITKGFKTLRIILPVIIVLVGILTVFEKIADRSDNILIECISLILVIMLFVVFIIFVLYFMRQYAEEGNKGEGAFNGIIRYFLIISCLLVGFAAVMTGVKIIANNSVKKTAIEVFESTDNRMSGFYELKSCEDFRNHKDNNMTVNVGRVKVRDTDISSPVTRLVAPGTMTEEHIVTGDIINERFGYNTHYYLLVFDDGAKILSVIPTCVYESALAGGSNGRIGFHAERMTEWDYAFNLTDGESVIDGYILYYDNYVSPKVHNSVDKANTLFTVMAKILIVAVSIAAYVTVMAFGYCDGHPPIYRGKDPERK